MKRNSQRPLPAWAETISLDQDGSQGGSREGGKGKDKADAGPEGGREGGGAGRRQKRSRALNIPFVIVQVEHDVKDRRAPWRRAPAAAVHAKRGGSSSRRRFQLTDGGEC